MKCARGRFMSWKMEKAKESQIRVSQAVQFAPQPPQHPKLGEDSGVRRQLQLSTHLGRLGPVDDLAPKRLPGRGRELRLEQLQSAADDELVVLPFPVLV